MQAEGWRTLYLPGSHQGNRHDNYRREASGTTQTRHPYQMCVLILSFLYKSITENKHHSVAYLTREAKRLTVKGSREATLRLHTEQASETILWHIFNTSTKKYQRKTVQVMQKAKAWDITYTIHSCVLIASDKKMSLWSNLCINCGKVKPISPTGLKSG